MPKYDPKTRITTHNHSEHEGAAKADTASRKQMSQLSDSLRRTENRMGKATTKGDTTETNKQTKIYRNVRDTYDIEAAKQDSAKAVGNLRELRKHGSGGGVKLNSTGEHYYGAETQTNKDLEEYKDEARKNAKRKESAKTVRDRAKP